MKKREETNRKKKSGNRVYIVVISGVLFVVLSVQLVRLYQKNQAYIRQEEEYARELEQEKEKQKELSDYEEYIHSEEYVEDTARQKLGLINPNETIFREK